jgi:pyruvate/2-oxoglutarate dehydrogenase complex dihydrolipoamide dehydrogenase (E3) component
VIGGGLVGLESADFLAAQGVQVTVVEMLDEIGGDMDPLAKAVLTARLRERQVKVHTSTKVLRITKTAAIAQKNEQEISLPLETVVVAVGVQANRTLPNALAESDLEIHVIGDAVKPRKALEAIWEGFEIGNKV